MRRCCARASRSWKCTRRFAAGRELTLELRAPANLKPTVASGKCKHETCRHLQRGILHFHGCLAFVHLGFLQASNCLHTSFTPVLLADPGLGVCAGHGPAGVRTITMEQDQHPCWRCAALLFWPVLPEMRGQGPVMKSREAFATCAIHASNTELLHVCGKPLASVRRQLPIVQ